MNIIKKISEFFTKKEQPTIPVESTPRDFRQYQMMGFNTKTDGATFAEELDILRYLSGIAVIRKESATEIAYQKLFNAEIEKECVRILKSSRELTELRVNAIEKAADQLERDEGALAMANAMEGRRRKMTYALFL